MSADRLAFSVEEAADLLGIARGTAYDAVRRGSIPSIKIGKRILIPREALVDMLNVAGKELPKELEP